MTAGPPANLAPLVAEIEQWARWLRTDDRGRRLLLALLHQGVPRDGLLLVDWSGPDARGDHHGVVDSGAYRWATFTATWVGDRPGTVASWRVTDVDVVPAGRPPTAPSSGTWADRHAAARWLRANRPPP